MARTWTSTAGLGLTLGVAACFAGDFVHGLPCANDGDCGPALECVEGFCGGPGELGVCGNGLVELGEECDDGNVDARDGCTPVCTLPVCGDGFEAPGELCDDGNLVNGDGCSATCDRCGDGIVQAWEGCDYDPAEPDACTPACQLHACGDGLVGPGEACDDGNEIETDACTTACTASPEVPVLTLTPSQVKQFVFDWEPALGAEFYRLYERAEAGAQLVELATDIVGESLALTVSLRERLNASYVLEACNALRCVASQEVHVVGTLAEAVGYFKASNTDTGGSFGWSVALSNDGDTLAVGAPGDNSAATGIDGDQDDASAPNTGAVYVFVREGGSWSQQAYVKPYELATGGLFGTAVALSGDGDTLAVSAPRADLLGEDVGGVHMFSREGGVWAQTGYVYASPTVVDGRLGQRLALSDDGDTLAVVDGFYVQHVEVGTVYVFARETEGWSQWSQQLARAVNLNEGLGHGYCGDVALSSDGDTLAVGTWDGVEVLAREGEGWSLEYGPTKGSETDYLECFGHSLALADAGDVLAVGEVAYKNDPIKPGRAYVLGREGPSWAERASFTIPAAGDRDRLGWSVDLSADGSVLVAGAIGEQSSAVGIGGDAGDDSLVDAGAAYVFVRKGASWVQQAYVKAAQTSGGDQLGYDLALSADAGTLVVGAPGENYAATGIGGELEGVAFNSGAVFVY